MACSASDVASIQIVWPTLNGATLVTFTFVAPIAAAAASVVPATLPEASTPKGRPDGPDVVAVGAGAVVQQRVEVLHLRERRRLVGSSCAIRLSTAGVYGAAASNDGEREARRQRDGK